MTIEKIVLTPVVETEHGASLPDHLPNAEITCWTTFEDEAAQDFEQVTAATKENASAARDWPYLDTKAWRKIMSDRRASMIDPDSWEEAPVIIAERRRNEALEAFIARMDTDGRQVVIASADDGAAGRMRAMLRKANGHDAMPADLAQLLGGKQRGVVS